MLRTKGGVGSRTAHSVRSDRQQYPLYDACAAAPLNLQCPQLRYVSATLQLTRKCTIPCLIHSPLCPSKLMRTSPRGQGEAERSWRYVARQVPLRPFHGGIQDTAYHMSVLRFGVRLTSRGREEGENKGRIVHCLPILKNERMNARVHTSMEMLQGAPSYALQLIGLYPTQLTAE